MRCVSLKDNKWINEITSVHENLIAEDGLNYQVIATSITLRYEMIIVRLKYTNDKIVVCEGNSWFKGFIWGHYESQMKVVQIEVLYVVPKYRKQGIATQLKRYLEIWAKDVGAIEAIVRNNNDNMVALNQKLGYQTTHLKMTKNL